MRVVRERPSPNPAPVLLAPEMNARLRVRFVHFQEVAAPVTSQLAWRPGTSARSGADAPAAGSTSSARPITSRRLARVQTHGQIVGGQDRGIAQDLSLPHTARAFSAHIAS